MDVLQGVSLSLFWVGMTLGPERTMQTIFCGIFFFFAENCLSNISPSFKRLQLQFTKSLIRFSFACSCVWCVLEDKRQRSHIFRRVDESFLCPQQTKNTGVFVCLSVIFQNQQWLLVVKTWMCTERQTTDSLLWSARKSYLFTVAVIFRIGTVRIELLANCKGEIDFQPWLLCPVCIR